MVDRNVVSTQNLSNLIVTGIPSDGLGAGRLDAAHLSSTSISMNVAMRWPTDSAVELLVCKEIQDWFIGYLDPAVSMISMPQAVR